MSIPNITYIDLDIPILYYREVMESEYISLSDARKVLNVSKIKMSQLVNEHRIKIFNNPLDKREKLVKRLEILKLRSPKPR